jgi:hypothetical protein
MSQNTVEARRPTAGVSATDPATTFAPRQAARAQAILHSLLNGHPPDSLLLQRDFLR